MNGNQYYKNFIKNISNKKIFLIQVFANLILQVFIAFIVLLLAENYNLIHNKVIFIGLVFSIFILIILMSFFKNTIIRFILFCIFSSLVGLMLSYKMDKNNIEEAEISKKAFITTICIFIFMVFYSFFLIYFGVKIPYQVGIALFFILLLIIIFMFIVSITGKYPFYHKAISGTIILLFSIFIGYDTITIMDRNYTGDFVAASLDYFIDLLNIFSSAKNIM